MCPPKLVGALIGKAGINIQEIKHRTGCTIKVKFSDYKAESNKVVEIVAKGASLVEAKGMVHGARLLVQSVIQYGASILWNEGQISRGAAQRGRSGAGQVGMIVVDRSLVCPDRSIHLLIGIGGANIKKIHQRTGCRIVVYQAKAAIGQDKVVEITGEASSIVYAKELVQSILQQHPTLSPARTMQFQRQGQVQHPKCNTIAVLPSLTQPSAVVD